MIKLKLSHQVQVGIFVAIGALFVMISILLVGGDRAFFKKYSLYYAELEQVQGLNPGSIVSLSGITVGNIKKITFSDLKKNLVVEMKIDSAYASKIREGSSVEIRTQGALGDKFLYIIPGPSDSPELPPLSFIETAKSGDLMGLLSEKGAEAGRIFDLIKEVHLLFKAFNKEGRSDKIFTNLVETSEHLKNISQETQKAISDYRKNSSDKLKSSLEKLSSILTKIDQGEGTLGALINDSSLHDRLKAVLGSSEQKTGIKTLLRHSIEKQPKMQGQTP